MHSIIVMMSNENIYKVVLEGSAREVSSQVKKSMAEGISTQVILNQGYIA